jgi:histidinol-phosphate phosphatase family protein
MKTLHYFLKKNNRFVTRVSWRKQIYKQVFMNKRAILLDRDGVINVEKTFVLSPGEIELYSFSAKAIRKINEARFLAIVITNQSAVARNFITIKQLQDIHDELRNHLKREGAWLDAIYFCPHREKLDEEVKNSEYIIDCECRKPKPGMLFRAAEDFGIDLGDSYFIGDSERDIIAGNRAGCTTIGVRTGHSLNGMKESPDYIFDNLDEAVNFILGREEKN